MLKNTGKILISPSIIASNLSAMADIARGFDKNLVELLHMDVMDGNFVPNLTFGPGYIKSLKSKVEIPMDVHLMINKPENSIDSYLELNPWVITIHYESTLFPFRLLDLIKKEGILSAIAINPATPVESIFDLLSEADMVLIMSVDPGFSGQSFIPASLKKIEKLKNFCIKENLDCHIQVDGGVNLDNISSIVKAGADILVAGSSVFNSKDMNENVKNLLFNAKK
jgi:ribulose-phosphate 3-epimerase